VQLLKFLGTRSERKAAEAFWISKTCVKQYKEPESRILRAYRKCKRHTAQK
jgi:hypothetical protein